MLCWTLLLWALTLAGIEAGPVVVVERSVETLSNLQNTPAYTQLGNFNLTTQHKSKELFSVIVLPFTKFTVDCQDCRTWGAINIISNNSAKAVAPSTSVNGSTVKPSGSFLIIELSGVGGHFDLSAIAAGSAGHSFSLFQSESPAGISLPNGDQVGLVFSLDLIFSLGDSLNFTGGFEVDLPPKASITVNPLSGKIVDFNIAGIVVKSLPLSVSPGAGTLGIALQARVQVGTTLVVAGTGLSFELAAFVNLVNFKITFDSQGTCDLGMVETLDIDVGAAAKEVVEIDFISFGVDPGVASVIAITTLGNSCLIQSGTTNPVSTQTASLSILKTPVATPATASTGTAISTIVPSTAITLPTISLSTPSSNLMPTAFTRSAGIALPSNGYSKDTTTTGPSGPTFTGAASSVSGSLSVAGAGAAALIAILFV